MKLGLIGFGYWGPNLARNFISPLGGSLSVIVDAKESRQAQAKKQFPTVEVYGDVQKLLSDPKIDAVIIATPAASHYPLAKRALEAGKHVLIEKPMTSSGKEADELNRLARERGLTLMVDHTFLYTGAVMRLKQMVSAGDLGELHYYDSTRINLGLFQNDVNVLWDLAAHDLSILLHLVKEKPLSVTAIGHAHLAAYQENLAHLTLHFESNFIAHFQCSWVSPVKIRQVLLGGTKKMVVFNDMEPTEKLKVYDSGYQERSDEARNEMLVDYRIGDIFIPKISPREALSGLAEDFIQSIAQKKMPLSNGELGAQVVKILEAAELSLKEKGARIALA